MSGRIERRFRELAEHGRPGLVIFVTAGDPDPETSAALVHGLAVAGADIIELGMPFSDPMADGPVIQAANQRALANGQTMRRTLDMVRSLRADDDATPVVLMGYYNPIHHYGVDAFVADAAAAGVDGMIVVDLPPEEDAELRGPASDQGLNLIRLIAPSTGDKRLKQLVENTGGFLYYVAVTGVTGTKSAAGGSVAAAVERIRRATDLPIAVGFGIRTPEQVAEISATADAAVVGSAVVQLIADGVDKSGQAKPGLAKSVLGFVADLAKGVRGASWDSDQG